MSKYERTSTLVNRKFYHYLIPTILSNVAMSLNEFVDSILVSHLLGIDAVGMVNRGFPVMTGFALIYMCFGIGGSVVFAEYAGKQDGEKAKRIFSSIFLITFVISVAITALGLIFLRPLAGVLCREQELIADFLPYLRILVFSGVLIIPVQILVTFLPSFGKPAEGTAINIIANVVNLIMDYVYIRLLNTGFKGAAMATLTGYVVGVIVLLAMWLLKRIEIPFSRFGMAEVREFSSTFFRGAAVAVSQLGYCIKVAFCNNLASSMGGTDGVNIFSLCMQTVSIMSIIIAGILGAMMPLVAALYGQGDRKGVKMLMKTVMIMQFVTNVILVAILDIFPQSVLVLYNVQGDLAVPAAAALRIFSGIFIFRGFMLIFMYYFQIVSRKMYAVIISVIDGFAGIIPLALILTHFLGITGIWLTFPMLSALLLAGILLTNTIIARRSEGKYSGLLLYEREEDIPVFDSTIALRKEDIVDAAKSLQEFCRKSNVSEKLSVLVALASEEMGNYSIEHKEKRKLDEIDLLLKVYSDRIVMDVRSIGKPFDITACDAEQFSNVDVIRKVASSIEYGYVTGMNQTRITIAMGA
ncbi:MATE family efflux transporter [Butyrivibrio sp. MC2021]|uniref:MATE family efflux transporter n=1 Tax=Butyrivibrio sp. MC2021 TaxID=1408306 RepID=UPI000478AC98|nr:MATE family efflux transporter [Butyrivibrio sp. MC2021]